MSLQPDFFFSRAEEITVDFLKQQHIRMVLFDADATLIQAHDDQILPERLAFVQRIQDAGIRILIASNGKTNRIEKAFGMYPVETCSYSLKPLPFRLGRCLWGIPKQEVLLVGDQFFTDVLCAKLLRIRSAMVEPYGTDKGFMIGFRRRLEKLIVKRK